MKLTQAIVLITAILLISPSNSLYAKTTDAKNTKLWLDCSYKLGEETKSMKLNIDAKNKAVRNWETGDDYDVETFTDDSIVFNFHYEELSSNMIINRKNGDFFQYMKFFNDNFSYKGSCKKISPPKPLF